MERIYEKVILDSAIGYAYHQIICDNEGIPIDYKFIEVNKAFEKYTGLNAKDIIGKRVSQVLPGILESKFDWIGYYGKVAIEGGEEEYEEYSEDLNRWYRIQVFSPKKYYFVTNFIDITELKVLAKKLMESERMLWEVMDTIPSRIFWKDKNLRYLGCNKKFAENAGISPKEVVGKNDYEMVWSDLADLYRKDDKYVIETGKLKLNFEEKTIDGDGNLKWVRTNKIPLYDNDNNIYGILGTFEDITEQKKIQEALRESQLRYEQLAEKSRSVIWEVDRNGVYTYVSPVAKEVFGYTSEEMVGKMHIYDLSHEDENNFKEHILLAINSSESVSDLENKVKNKDNKEAWVMTNGFPVLNDKGEILFYRGMDIDITYLKKIEQDIKFLSFHDQLTGLYNRRFFEEELKRLDTDRNLPLSLVMIDVNGLKLVNDAFGHNAGDLLLKKTANILKTECRADDIVSRVGGDEFVILFPRTSLKETEKIIHRINMAIKKEKVEAVNLSISYGCDTKENIHEKIEDILKKADAKMYKLKSSQKSNIRKDTIGKIIKSLFENSPQEEEHAKNVGDLSVKIGRVLKLSDSEIDKLRIIGRLHDIGKISVSKDILNKRGTLNRLERKEIERHPEVSYIILSSSNEYSFFAEDVLYHHERYDGKGYPKGLKGEEIPLNSRIVFVADAYDAMINDRPYRKAMKENEAIKIIKEESGKQFDPNVVEAFLNIIEKEEI